MQAILEGVKSIVILGAGLDTRAYRIPGAEAFPGTEMDLPEVLGTKRRLLEAISRPLSSHPAFAPVDLTSEPLEQALRMNGVNTDIPTIFLAGGVTRYVPPDAVAGILGSVGQTARGNRLVFTCLLRSVVEGHSDIQVRGT